jgi:GntR family transcriptional regulator
MAPIYQDIIEYIRKRIENKEWVPGDTIPTERALCEIFQVSRMTVRHAVDELTQEGILIRKRGSGTYVSSPRLIHDIEHLSLSHDAELLKDDSLVSKVISLELVESDPYAIAALKLGKNEYAWKLKRLRILRGTPIAYEIIFFPQKYFPIATKDDFTSSFDTYMRERAPFEYDFDESNVAVEATKAFARTAKFLQIPVASSLLSVKIITRCKNGMIPNCSINFFPGDMFTFVVGEVFKSMPALSQISGELE